MTMSSPLDIQQFLDQDQQKDLLRFLTAGSVDDGKSTLIGKLLFDSKKIYEDQLSALESDSKRIGHAGSETDYALLLDGLQAEREQGITIDVAYRYFSTSKRKFIIADTPGHEQYTRNMVTGASTANLAIILIDARKGVIKQTKRHTFLVNLLGIKHVVLAVNKMDLVDYDEEVFNTICANYKQFVTRLNIPDIYFIPLSALKGDNVVENSANMGWYKGKSLLNFLESVHISSDRNFEDFRFPVQHVLRPDIHFRGFSGKISSGIVKKGEEIMVLPSRKTSKITRIIGSEGDTDYAFPPQSVTITLADEIDISRGDLIVHPHNIPRVERQFEAMLVWMDENPMDPYAQFYIKHSTNSTRARLDEIRYRVDVNTLEQSKCDTLSLNEIARVVFTTNKALFFDPYHRNRNTGSFILIDPITHNTCAVGMIIDKLNTDDLHSRIIDPEQMAMIKRGKSLINPVAIKTRYNQRGTTIWITGLHGSGKNVLAYTLEKVLFDQGATVVMLDGSTVRSGLSKELDFTPAGRAEQVRRVAHVCLILNNEGLIVICSFITEKEHIRQQISQLIGQDRFHLVYMNADLAYCRNNKPDLYERAENGELKFLPGIDILYEIPQKPDLTLHPEDSAENIETLLHYLQLNKIFPLE